MVFGAEYATAFWPHLCLLSFLCPVLTHALSWSLCKKLRVVCSEVAAEAGELNLVSGVSDSTAAPSQHRLCHLCSVGGFGAGHVNLHHNVPHLILTTSALRYPLALVWAWHTLSKLYYREALKITEAKGF